MYAAVVELDTLADPIGPRTEDQHLGPFGLRGHLCFGGGVELVAAVVVGGLGFELRRAGVHRLVYRVDAQAHAQ
ncbi:Uncharacterised protein [Mycobacterium tuberculosis]|uniref:Uncharacterized protein n=1 Tax=Mycobacterium tuberculosis TaxID=1773 RepID=A0A916L9L5_MYCTX|nr:Uncharacterised protein [Mycobacterium tuberculosis]COX45929.1 Uncharacterised protein [Mycobacterium tuberculosis]